MFQYSHTKYCDEILTMSTLNTDVILKNSRLSSCRYFVRWQAVIDATIAMIRDLLGSLI